MGKVDRFEDLDCWKSARIFARDIFLLTDQGKLKTDFDLKSQLRRATLSIMNNIAEGFSRYHRKDFIKFLDYSQSSSSEVKSMLYLLEDINYLDDTTIKDLHHKLDTIRNLTLGLIRYLDKAKK